jgi:hypothetical protein
MRNPISLAEALDWPVSAPRQWINGDLRNPGNPQPIICPTCHQPIQPHDYIDIDIHIDPIDVGGWPYRRYEPGPDEDWTIWHAGHSHH